MRHSNRWIVAVLIIILALQLAACGQPSTSPTSTGVGGGSDEPAKLEPLGGTGLNRVILSAQAAKRLGIQTASVRDTKVQGKLRKVVPYAAMIYDLHGETWVYTNPSSLTFVRERISVDYIDGDLVVLSAGPPSGTAVVTVGVPELYGTEFEGGLQP
jgi:hypothetical protein